MATTAQTITARKLRRCDGVGCDTVIHPGDEYARHVAFPGDSDLGNERFWVLHICPSCHTRYGEAMPRRK